MAEDTDLGEKTEPASPRKRQEAREKGQVAKSSDLNSAVLLLGAALILYILSGSLLAGISGLIGETWDGLGTERIRFDVVVSQGAAGLLQLGGLLAPFAIGIMTIALLINVLQVGVRISWKPLELDITKLSPIKGAKRILSKRGLMRLLFGLLKLLIVGMVLYSGFRTLILEHTDRHLTGLFEQEVDRSWSFLITEIFYIAIRAGIALLIISIFDVLFQRWQHEQDLRMTKHEVREELKRMEGDPKLKERRRRIQQQLALQRMMHDVPNADVVITNPTHFSCALKYEEEEMSAPLLVAKGQDHLAHRIRELAIEHGIPIVEKPPLARSIFNTTEVGEEIPPDLYEPVAEVLSYVYRVAERRKASV